MILVTIFTVTAYDHLQAYELYYCCIFDIHSGLGVNFNRRRQFDDMRLTSLLYLHTTKVFIEVKRRMKSPPSIL